MKAAMLVHGNELEYSARLKAFCELAYLFYLKDPNQIHALN